MSHEVRDTVAGGLPQRCGAFVLFNEKYQTEWRLTTMHETRAVFPLCRGTRGIGQTDVLLIGNPSDQVELLLLAGLDGDGRVGQV